MGKTGFGRRPAARLLSSADPEFRRSRQLFGRRRGRVLGPKQKNLITGLLPSFAVSIPAVGRLEPQTLFRMSPRSTWLEIGFGGGEHLAAQAEVHPDVCFIGCEVFENGIAKLLAQIKLRHLKNIRIFDDDARLIMSVLPPASIDRVFILFPDPWPKRRHHKRRIVSPQTLDTLAKIMTDNSELRLATDDPGYLCWMLQHVTDHPEFEWLARRAADWREPPLDWPRTRYEQKARAAGRLPSFLRVRRRARIGR